MRVHLELARRLALAVGVALCGGVAGVTLGCGASGGSCGARLDALAPTLERAETLHRLGRHTRLVELVEASGSPVAPEQVVALDLSMRQVDSALVREFFHRSFDGSQPASIGLAFSRETPWEEVVRAVQIATRNGAPSVSLLALGPENPLGLESASFKRLTSRRPDDGLASLADEFVGMTRWCRALRELLSESLVSDEPGAALFPRLADTLRGCGCRVADDDLLAMIAVAFVPGRDIVGVSIDPLASAPVVLEKPAETPWSEVAAEVFAAAPAVKLEVLQEPGWTPCIPPPPLTDAERRVNEELARRLLGDAE